MKIPHKSACFAPICLVFCVFIYFSVFTAQAQEVQYGLNFNSSNYEPEKRTSLNLSPNGYLSFPDGFSMTFNAKFHFRYSYTYGYIFRIITGNENSIDFVMGDGNLVFSMSLDDIISNNPLTEVNVTPGQWIPIRVTVDIKNEKLEIQIGEYVKKWNSSKVREFDDVGIVFGKNDYLKKQVIDVPDMTIKDLIITDISGTPEYSWKLSKHTLNGVYDDLKYHFAKCENPDWVLDHNNIWKKEIGFKAELNPYLSYDPDKHIVAAADENTFYTFSIKDNQLKKHTVNKKLAYKLSSNQMIYNTLDSSFYAYNLVKQGDLREFVPFNLPKGEWGNTTEHQHTTDYRHHNRYFSSKNNRLYLFGGYGHLKYKKDVLIYDVNTGSWSNEAIKGDNITPRYLSGMGKIDEDHLLFFGGYGSETGNQAIQAQFYYDCYIVDINTMEAKRIWTLNNSTENFVISNSLVVDTLHNCFYGLCYPSMKSNSMISLCKFSLDKPEYEVMANQIPIRFIDIFSYVDLFYDESDQKLIAATMAAETGYETDISIYTLSFPPLKNSDVYQTEKEGESFPILVVIIITVIIFIFIALLLFRRKKKQIDDEDGSKNDTNNEDTTSIVGINNVKKLQNQAIYLFGGFQVIDKQGRDVTADFKPLLKHLFLLILLNTIKNGKGISFSKLKDILWFDKSEESANNNRGVALSKIRQIMEAVGKTHFDKKGTYWSIEFKENIYCDYYESLVLIKKIKENNASNIGDVKKLLSIVTRGELLPNIQTEWGDIFKSDFSNDLVDLILQLIRQKETVFSDDIYFDLANALFIHDPLNEDALKLKCRILVKMGKNGLAGNTYAAFVKEYAALFGSDYKYSFDQILNETMKSSKLAIYP